MRQHPKPISIEELANGKLPEHLQKSIGGLKVTLQELSEWRTTQPPVNIAVKEGYLNIDMRVRLSLKKLIAIVGGTVGLVWAIIKFFVEAWPIITKWYLAI